ncbi:DUF3658 domain-containing protein [Undibacterium parvum]|uniref:DUF3658 domain-containing protein n=1 Tax=Undibacterium parvum TaxID=401471 RepID=A0A3Q9BRV1_9BURK|nr:DUF3658 domain-containing protein [Undibacterium parvum]AZP13043.1 hypothetical protein EJN92_14160 [Undibacterium parvum]
MPSDLTLNALLVDALEKLDLALNEALNLSQNSSEDFYHIGTLGRSIGLIREFQSPILEKYPELKPPPPWQDWSLPELTHEEIENVSEITNEELEAIDLALLSYSNHQFQKVARIVGVFMTESKLHKAGIPDIFYSQRIEALCGKGLFEFKGNLKFMRYCEVRLTQTAM